MRWVLLPLLAGSLVLGQEYRKHNVNFVAGAGIPREELSNLLSTSGGIGFSYYYRPIRWLAAEAGYETLFGAAEIREWVQTGYGNLRIRDYQQFLPFGGRVILPLAAEKVQVYGGGGGAYIRYSERLSQPYNYYGYRFECPMCSLRDGLGYYATAGANIAIDRGQMFRVGGGVKMYRGAVSGDRLGPVPSGETRDGWLNIFGSFGLSF